MIEIECLVCGKAIKPRQLNDTDNYDAESYDGQVVCQECKSLLYVKLVKGKARKYKIVEKHVAQKEVIHTFNFILPDGTKFMPGISPQPNKEKPKELEE